MRAAPFLAFGLVASLVAAACSGDDSGNGGSSSAVPPTSCLSPCTPGDLCFGPVEPSCNGSWYCWSDAKWYCSPQDSGGPADATLFEATFGDDASDETEPVNDSAAVTDAGEGGPG